MRSLWGQVVALLEAGPPEAGGCLEWPWARTPPGYGRIRSEGTDTYAHRVSYVRANGLSLADIKGLFVCHTCDNPACFWPGHLFLGTAKTNSLDMVAKGRGRGMDKTHCPQGHPYSGDNLVIHQRKNRSGLERICRICANNASRLAKARRRALLKASR